MGKHKIREDKICLNCGTIVENRFCPNCGQENIESRESFHHLFIEFVADLVHYDSSFWRTTRYLLFSPAKLSLEYMNGKRKSYVNPVKLYIFVSFIAFFVPEILPSPTSSSHSSPQEVTEKISVDNKEKDVAKEDKELKEKLDNTKEKDHILFGTDKYGGLYSAAQLDSIHYSRSAEDRMPISQYYMLKGALKATTNFNNERSREKVLYFVSHNISKVLFIYMPIFAFWMWLFHLNRKKYYFDSGIFTLHFFSFWLLMVTFLSIMLNIFYTWLDWAPFSVLFIIPAILTYITFYFFRANRNFYGESRLVSNLKAIALFLINTFFLFIIMLSYIIFAFVKEY